MSSTTRDMPVLDRDVEVPEDAHDARGVARGAVARDRHEVDFAGDGQLAHQVGHEEDRALEHADEQQVAARVVGRDIPGQGNRRACEARLLVDEDLRDRAARSQSGSRTASTPSTSTIPGTATTSSPRTTSGHDLARNTGHLRVDEHALDLLSSSRPARLIAWTPPAYLKPLFLCCDPPRGPSAPRWSRASGERSSHARSYSRTIWRPRPRSRRTEPSIESSSSTSSGGAVLRCTSREQIALRSRVQPAQEGAGSRRGSGRASSPGSSCRGGSRGPRRGSTPRCPRADGRQRPDDAVGAAPVDLARGAARDDPVEDGLDLVRCGVARRAEPVGRERVADARATRPRCRRRVPSTTSAPRASRQNSASSSDSRPRRPWFTCNGETSYPSSRRMCQRQVESAPPETRHVTGRGRDQLVLANVGLDGLPESTRLHARKVPSTVC